MSHKEIDVYPTNAPRACNALRNRAVFLAVLFSGCNNMTETKPHTSRETSDTTIVKNDPDIHMAKTKLRFEDITKRSGVEAVYRTGRESGHYAILESLGGGVGVLDFDRDGFNDLFFPQGGGFEGETIFAVPSLLYRNRGDATFDEISTAAGLAKPEHYTHGCGICDFDNDGFADVLVTGYGGLQLHRNMGDGSFIEVHNAAGLTDHEWSSSAAWGDINGDSHPDLYVAHYVDWSLENQPECPSPLPSQARDVCPPRAFSGVADIIYTSNGDGTFRDATSSSGLRPDGKGLSVLMSDLDQDGDNDIYVANDMVDNFFYQNDGRGKFEEVGLLTGTATDFEGFANGSMGLAVCDYNADLAPDLWVTNYEGEAFALYRNDGNGNFLHASREASITSLGGRFVGFGTAAADLDCDGDEDVVVANGHVVYYPKHDNERQEQLLLENIGDGQFRRTTPSAEGYFSKAFIGRGVALADLNDDGLLDVVITHSDEPAALLLNRSVNPNQSVRFQLIGRTSARQPVGASVILKTDAGMSLRTTSGGGSYLSHGENDVHFGLPLGEQAIHAIVKWPSGQEQIVKAIQRGENTTVVETD